MYRLDFPGLCQKLHRALITQPERVWGGLLHRVYKMWTDVGCYAVKALNPEVMGRKEAMENLLLSETIANAAKRSGICAAAAVETEGRCIHEVDGQYYMLFPWVEGRSLPLDQVSPEDCRVIGEILAKIHAIQLPKGVEAQKNRTQAVSTDWIYYAREGTGRGLPWAQMLGEKKGQLCLWERMAHDAAGLLSGRVVPGHRDLDPKNVLWEKSRNPVIIDWEAAGGINPAQELLDVALNWSGAETGTADEEAFCAVLAGYRNGGGKIEESWPVLLFLQFKSRFAWLEFNLKRSLGIGMSDNAEGELGTAEVVQTLLALEKYAGNMPLYLKWLLTKPDERVKQTKGRNI